MYVSGLGWCGALAYVYLMLPYFCLRLAGTGLLLSRWFTLVSLLKLIGSIL
jgi:hypothetical protein